MKALQHGYIAFVLTVLAPAQTHGDEREKPTEPVPQEQTDQETVDEAPGRPADLALPNKQDRWLELIIPEFFIEESGVHVLVTLSDEIKRLDGEALGFSEIIFDSKIANVEIKHNPSRGTAE